MKSEMLVASGERKLTVSTEQRNGTSTSKAGLRYNLAEVD
jgi:hypothetical protein